MCNQHRHSTLWIDSGMMVKVTPQTIPRLRGEPVSVRTIARYGLAGILIFAGIGHMTFARTSFQAQVPGWVPGNVDTIVLLSGAVEIGLGAALISIRTKWIGWVAGAFFIAVFPGNIAQFLDHRDAFGLDTDTRRLVRLFFQPILVAWAVWSTSNLPMKCSD
jgi:uncharacterized membrane protein